MNTTRRYSSRKGRALAVALAAGVLVACAAWGQGRHEVRGREIHEPYRTPHLFFDDRYRHGHYYPVVGYGVSALPPGFLSISFTGRRFFYHGGVWYQPAPRGFVVVRPPLGVVVPVLPPAYTMVWTAGTPYYYANDLYYVEAPGGYAVAAPPAGTVPGIELPAASAPPAPAVPSPPPAPPAPLPQTPPTGMPSQAPVWYYCDSSKSYYPYAAECKEGWRTVPATPPGVR